MSVSPPPARAPTRCARAAAAALPPRCWCRCERGCVRVARALGRCSARCAVLAAPRAHAHALLCSGADRWSPFRWRATTPWCARPASTPCAISSSACGVAWRCDLGARIISVPQRCIAGRRGHGRASFVGDGGCWGVVKVVRAAAAVRCAEGVAEHEDGAAIGARWWLKGLGSLAVVTGRQRGSVTRRKGVLCALSFRSCVMHDGRYGGRSSRAARVAKKCVFSALWLALCA